MSAEKRKGLLDEASDYVTRDRNAAYGEPEDNFAAIAELWAAQGMRVYENSHGAFADEHRKPNATDVALFMAGLKLARLRGNPNHRDSWVDGIGYFACGGDIALVEESSASEPVPAPTKTDTADGHWVSHNRCSGVFADRPHPSHRYPQLSERGLSVKPSGWCDGYGASQHHESDTDVVKRVADKIMRANKRVGPTQVTDADGHEKISQSWHGRVQSRPIRDNPQA